MKTSSTRILVGNRYNKYTPPHDHNQFTIKKCSQILELHTLFKRPAFFVGSRYGRSSGNAASGSGSANSGVGTSKTRRLIIVPRNDRFFLGSRYGKRSDEYLSPYEQSSLGLGMNKASVQDADRSMDTAENTEQETGRARTTTMSCVFTGISNFYRCNNVHT